MSNILDSELNGGKPAERPHGKVVGTAVMDSKLLFKVCKGIKAVTRIKALLVLTVAALNLTIMPWGIRSDELVANAKFLRCRLKQRRQIPFTVGKAVGNSKPLSVWTHSTWMPRRAYHFTSFFKKSAEE